MRLILAVTSALFFSGGVQAATILNGSFEIGTAPRRYLTVPAGGTAIANWTVGGGGVDYIGSTFVAQDGVRSLDLSAGTAGSVSQDIETIANSSYVVSFYMSGNPGGAPGVKTLIASAGGDSQVFSISAASFSAPNIVWTPYTFRFLATAPTTTLTFASGVNTSFGPALDNVAITAIPEPESWAMLLAGLGLVGFAMRHRGKPAAA